MRPLSVLVLLAWRSLLNRRLTLVLTVVAIALAVAMLLGVERLRQDARQSFAQTVAGTDLLVGPRGGAVQLLLHAVFHIGQASHALRWDSVQALSAHPAVAWWVPLSLGDSHRGFRVVGTTEQFFQHYQYRDRRALTFASGGAFSGLFDVVLGAEVAAQLGYRLGDAVVLQHGMQPLGGAEHDDKPFTVSGILARTGTPVDRAVWVSLEGLEAVHVDWVAGTRVPGLKISADQVRRFNLQPKTVSAALIGLKSRTQVFQVQRWVNAYSGEPLMAILPGATLQELWSVVGLAERALLAVSALVVLVGLSGLVAVVVAGLAERRRELAILRALGAGPGHIFLLLLMESVGLAVFGCVVGLALLEGAVVALGPWLAAEWGVHLSSAAFSAGEWRMLGAVVLAALIASLVPAVRAYRYSLADGMTVKV